MMNTGECIRGDGFEENDVSHELSQVAINDDSLTAPERTVADDLLRQHHTQAFESSLTLLPNYRLNAPCLDDANETDFSFIESESDSNPSQVVINASDDIISQLTERERTEANDSAQAFESDDILDPNYRLNAPCLDDANEADLSVIGSGNDNHPQHHTPMATNWEAITTRVIEDDKEAHNEATDLTTPVNGALANLSTPARLATSTLSQLPEEIMRLGNHLDIGNSMASASLVLTDGRDENRPAMQHSTVLLSAEGSVNNSTNMTLWEDASSNHRRSTTIQLPETSPLPTTSFNMQVLQSRRPSGSRFRRGMFAATRGRFILIVTLQSALLLAAVIAIFVLVFGRSDETGTTTAGGNGVPASPNPTSGSTLNSIRAKGYLVCGVVERLGFSMFNTTTQTWSGFEVDLCRAVGAAIFGADGHVNFTALTNDERFIALQAHEVDLLAAAATYTMERDLYEPSAKAGFTFSVPYLYNGLSFAGQPKYVTCADQRNITGNCSGLEICVQDSTTHVGTVNGLFPGAVNKLAPTLVDFYNNFVQGHCNVLAGEQFDLAAYNVRQAGYSGNYSVSNNLYSKDPLALVTRDDDVEWSDYVNWVFLALLTAENKTVTQQMAQNVIGSERPGPTVDISLLWAYHAVATVGNYAEMYTRHLQRMLPRAPVNEQNKGITPLFYSLPFGNNTTVGPGPIANGTLERILQRGCLRCGVGTTPFFAEFSGAGQQWSGLDVYVCMAISAAIFNGVGSTQFIQMNPDKRFLALASDDIDLLVRTTSVTYIRDVNEPFTHVGFAFSPPTYYGGVMFGGIPPYADCANNLDVTSSECKGLLICVSNATTDMNSTRRLFPEWIIRPMSSEEAVYSCLANKTANVIAIFDSREATVRKYYNGSYQEGETLFSRDNLAPITRQDDPQWSSFVNWIMHALFNAEEQGITQATYWKMPPVNLFGSKFSGMFQNAIQAFGSYGEIYNQSAGSSYPRTPINRLNVNPLGPQHYPPSGLFGLS